MISLIKDFIFSLSGLVALSREAPTKSNGFTPDKSGVFILVLSESIIAGVVVFGSVADGVVVVGVIGAAGVTVEV
jgi:hypothetical protein